MNLQQAYYEQKFEIEFLRAKGDSFQTLIERLMSMAYRDDFIPCRPWGNIGDRKNDGFLKSEKCLFQMYAPNDMDASKAMAKITEDFEGAKVHWGKHFNKWVFAHNATDGLPPHVISFLLEFDKANPDIKVEHWCLDEFRIVFRTLSEDDLQTWFGFAPTNEIKANLGFSDLQVVLETIANRPAPISQIVRDVPMGKIEANALSESIATLLKAGMTKTTLVESFFQKWHDNTLGERVAESFKAKYAELKETFVPNELFAELQSWAGGDNRRDPQHELAVLAIIAYYFERCDIYEAPNGEQT